MSDPTDITQELTPETPIGSDVHQTALVGFECRMWGLTMLARREGYLYLLDLSKRNREAFRLLYRVDLWAPAALTDRTTSAEQDQPNQPPIDEKIRSVAVDIHADLQQRKHLRIGVFDYTSCVRCLTSAFDIVFPDYQGSKDLQNMIQLMGAEISRLRLEAGMEKGD